MASLIKWAAASTQVVAIDLGTTLGTDTLSAVGAEIDGSTLLNTYGWIEVATSSGNLFASAVTKANATLDIYMIQAPDGTNYQKTPVTADVAEYRDLQVLQLGIPTEIGVVPRVGNQPIALPPHKFKFLLYNNAGQTMNDTWQVNVYTNNLENK